MKYYLQFFPRPIGLEPTIYLYDPSESRVKDENEEYEDYFSPEVHGYNSLSEALKTITDFLSEDLIIEEFKFKVKKED